MSRHGFIPNWRGIYQFLRDGKTDWKPKLLVILGILYLVWPVDLLPDVLPVIGWLDDLGVAVFVIWYLSRVTDRYLESSKRK